MATLVSFLKMEKIVIFLKSEFWGTGGFLRVAESVLFKWAHFRTSGLKKW